MSLIMLPPEHHGVLGALYAKIDGQFPADKAAELLAQRNISAVTNQNKGGCRPGPSMGNEEIVRLAQAWARHYQHRAGLPDFSMDDIYTLVESYLEQVRESQDWNRSPEQEICKTIYLSANSFPRWPVPKVKWIWQEKSCDPDAIWG